MKTTFLYVLVDPETGEIRYVGKADSPRARLAAHLSDASRCHRTNWIQELRVKGLAPRMEVLFEVPDSEWGEWEKRYITIFRDSGCDLVNGTLGGDGGVPTQEVRKKISVTLTGRRFSAEHRLNMRRAQLGRTPSVETRERISRAGRGRRNSPDAIARGAKAHRSKPQKNNWTGFPGVSLDKKSGKWEARLNSPGNRRGYLGRFLTVEAAVSARGRAMEEYFGVAS